MLARLSAQAKGLEIVKLDSVGNNTMVTVRANAQPRLALVNLGWNRADTDKLRYVELLKAWNPAADTVNWSPAHSTREMLQRIDRNVDALTRMGSYSGTVLIARGDSVCSRAAIAGRISMTASATRSTRATTRRRWERCSPPSPSVS